MRNIAAPLGTAAGLAVILVLTAGTTPTLGGAVTNSTNLSVSVGALVSVTLEPDSYDFTNVGIGETNFSDTSALRFVLSNNGSVAVSNVYVHAGTLRSEQDNPLGKGSAKEYAATSFLWIRNNTGGSNTSTGFRHVGALTWNITRRAGGTPTGIKNDLPGAVSHGFYRNATGYYLWSMAPDRTGSNAGTCASTEARFRIKTRPVAVATRDMSVNVSTYVPLGANGDWAQARATTGPLKGHYIAFHRSCEKAYIFRFDASDQFPVTGNADQYLIGPMNQTALDPGERFRGRVGVAVPGGIPAGQTNQTTLTIHASAVS